MSVLPGALYFITLGCAKNEVDTRFMQRDAVDCGYTLTDDPDIAEAVIVNTCAFIQSAVEESLQTVFEASTWTNVQEGRTKIIVCGCMPSRYGKELAEELTEAHSFIPCADESLLVSTLKEAIGEPANVIHETISPELVLDSASSPFVSYVSISDGCSRKCAYCKIPQIRGAYHSFSYDNIVQEVQRLADHGSKEIVLIGQDTSLWGSDLKPQETLASLLERLARAYPSIWFRVLYVAPTGVTDELLGVMAAHDNICNYLDIPLQHSEASILASMNRSGSREEYLELIDHIRAIIPDIALRTTFLVGFPGETDKDFEALCDFAEQAAFEYAGVFAFSPEDGTLAYDMPDQVDPQVSAQRAAELRELCDSISNAVIVMRQGTVQRVLIEGQEEDGQLYGRSQSQAPEVDGETFVDTGAIGEMVTALIEDTMFYEMEATVVS